MSKNIRINVELKDRSKNLFSKGTNIMDCLLDVPTLDPTCLNPFDDANNKIYRVEVKPVVNRVHLRNDGSFIPDTGVSGLNVVGVQSEIVKSVASVTLAGEQCARINGSIDMPIKGHMKRTTLEEAWFTDQDTANAVCMAAAEVELEKALKMEEEVTGAVKVLTAIRDLYESGEPRSMGCAVKSSKKSSSTKEYDEQDLVADLLEEAATAIRNDDDN
jgi:hypothetical protein